MNEQLIKFIELCLMDGIITEKEREVIFRKSKELGVDKDECEIILESMIQKKSQEINQTISEPKKKKGFFGSFMDEIKKGVENVKSNIDVDLINEQIKNIKSEYQKNLGDVNKKSQSIPHSTKSEIEDLSQPKDI